MAEHDKRIAMLDCESSEYQRRMDQNLAEITDKLTAAGVETVGLVTKMPGDR